MIYKGYTIKRVTYQGTTCYKVAKAGSGYEPELAANIQTARKWIDAEIAERRACKASGKVLLVG